jgi:hypothetical protein
MMSAMASVMTVVAKTGVSIVRAINYRIAIELANPIGVEIVAGVGGGGQKGTMRELTCRNKPQNLLRGRP